MTVRALAALSFTALVLVFFCGGSGALTGKTNVRPADSSRPSLDETAWNADRAMNDIKKQLLFTPRSLGTAGHAATIQYIEQQLRAVRNAEVHIQRWQTTGYDDHPLTLVNIIARIDPTNPRRVLVGTHYDSIVRAYADQNNPTAPMPGANNSASGVALLLETVRALGAKPVLPDGIDFVFFDGEEGIRSLGAGDPFWKPLGSPYFVDHIREFYRVHLPRSAVIFDMVCFKDLRLRPEPSSLSAAKTEVRQFWSIGKQITPSMFVTDPARSTISDDHTALIDAGVPSFLVIDFDYAPWFNTTQDTIDKCSPESLRVTGRTLLRYLHAPKG